MRELSSELLNLPFAPLRGEPGVRDRCPPGTAQLAHYPAILRKIKDFFKKSEDAKFAYGNSGDTRTQHLNR